MNTFFRLDMPRVSKETQESREKVAANLKLIIKAKGLRQNAFAQEIGIDDSNLSQILGAKRTMGEDLIGRVSKKFGLSYETIKYGTNLAEALGLPASGTDKPDMSHHIAEREAIYRVDRPGEVLDWNSAGRGVPFYDVDVFAGDVVAFNDFNNAPRSDAPESGLDADLIRNNGPDSTIRPRPGRPTPGKTGHPVRQPSAGPSKISGRLLAF